jgi:phage shock protein PspC (stress-responsive transcriptional regulator)
MMSNGWPLEVMATGVVGHVVGVVGHVLGFFALTVALTCLMMAAVFLLFAAASVIAYIIQELTGDTDDGW